MTRARCLDDAGRVLVLDPGSLTAVSTVRALGSAGWKVGVGTEKRDSAASASRHCGAKHFVPSPGNNLDEFVEAVNRAVAESGYEIIFGCGDAQVFALSAARERIKATVPYAPNDILRRAFDKLDLIEVARDAGLGVPRTAAAGDPAAASLTPPLAVKSRWHWSPGGGAAERIPVSICETHADAGCFAEHIKASGGQAVFQEYQDGWLLSFNVVTDRHCRPLAMLQQKAHGIWPLRAGTPSRGVTMEIDSSLAAGIIRFLKALGWFGLVNLQFIVPEDGNPRLIDFNGRPYQTLSLALGAGINFLDIWARAATDRDLYLPEPARPGIRYYDFRQEMLRIRAQYGVSPVRLAESFGFALTAKHIIWTLDDLRPVVAHYRRVVDRQFAKKRRIGAGAS